MRLVFSLQCRRRPWFSASLLRACQEQLTATGLFPHATQYFVIHQKSLLPTVSRERRQTVATILRRDDSRHRRVARRRRRADAWHLAQCQRELLRYVRVYA